MPPDVVARVGERMVTLGDFKRYLDRNTGTDLAQLGPEVASAMVDQYLEEVILSEYAAAHGVEIPAEKIASAVRNDAGATVIEKRDEMRRQKLIGDQSENVPAPSDADIRAYYEQHPAEFRSGEELHVKQILVHDEAVANDIAAKLKAGDVVRGVVEPVLARAEREEGRRDRLRQPRRAAEDVRGRDLRAQAGQRQRHHPHRRQLPHFQGRGPPSARRHRPATAAPVIRERLKDDAIRDRMAQLVAKARSELQVAVLTKRLPFKYTGGFPKSENE